jgi:hypothetical protein
VDEAIEVADETDVLRLRLRSGLPLAKDAERVVFADRVVSLTVADERVVGILEVGEADEASLKKVACQS